MSAIYLKKQIAYLPQCKLKFYLFVLLLAIQSTTDAVTLSGSSEYAVPGNEFRMTCNTPEEANQVLLYRRPNTTPVGGIQIGGGQCYNVVPTSAVVCTPEICSCTTNSDTYGTEFQWTIQPQTGDHGSVWYCRRTNPSLPDADRIAESNDYTLKVADGPGTPTLSPTDTTYTRTEGDTLPDITYTADCRPGCTFVWTKPDNTNFTASPVLSLGQLDRSEHGTYRCTARNVVGELSTSTTVNILYGPGTITLSPPDTTYTRTEGDTLPDITCTADCRPGCTFIWTKPDNTNFTASPVLSLGQLDRSEHGTYRCTARNVVGELSTSTTVNILYGPTTVVLDPLTLSYTITEGQTLPTIRCSSDCNPACTYRWTKDGQSYTAGSYLRLTNIQRGQAGVYRCTATNIYGSQTSSNITVTVNYGPGDSVSFQPGQDGFDKIENQTVPDIICSADCIPACSFVWSKSGITYPNPLSVTTANRGNAGTYTCTASNSVSQTTKTWNLIVRFPPRILSLGYTQGNADVTENGSKSLLCSVESYPPSIINWYYQNSTNTLLTDTDVLESTYTLTPAACLDTGMYTCSARNSISNIEATKDIRINVLCKPRQDHRVEQKYSFGLATLETLTIRANFLSNPQPSFNWTFQSSSGTPVTLLANGIDNFGIQNIFEMNELSAVSVGTRSSIIEAWFGSYHVTASNSQGSGTLSFKAVARAGPLHVGLTPPTTSYTVTEGQTLPAISCSSDCNPVCTYRWTKDGQSYTIGSDLRLTNIRRSQTGAYWCTASNAYGSQTSSDINIIVNQSHITGDGAETTRNTGVVLISVGSVMILLSLLVFAVAIFMLRKGRLPYGRQNTTGKGRSTSTLPRSEDIGGFGHDRYEDLNLDQIEPPSEYDEVSNSPPDNDNNTTGNTRNVYEHLQRQSTANTYEDIPPKPGTGSDGMYVNTAPK